MTNLVYPGPKALAHQYDALGRLTNQVDWANRQMNYAYDQAGRLVNRSYPNGVVQTNSFDTAGRLTSLSYLTNSTAMIALTYAYDRNGNKTFMGEKGTFAWPTPTLTDEASRFSPAGKITNRVDALNPANNFTYQYDLSGNMTNASGGGQSWRLTYDEDNRTTSINWTNAVTNTTIINRYDALGRRISRTVDGGPTTYALSLSGGMERILYEVNPDSSYTYYVHGLDLSYKETGVLLDTTVTYFHADAQGNIISLTDNTNAATVAQYAYTPYGRSLGSTNYSQSSTPNSQPFTFVGSQGVMEELPGLYFMRARYYSADAGMFLSTDPVKSIGAGWKPITYGYAAGNSFSYNDPKGEFIGADDALFIAGILLYVATPYIESFAEGWLQGTIENVSEDASLRITDAVGFSKASHDNSELAFAVRSTVSTIKDARKILAETDPSGLATANFAGEQVANYTTKPIENMSQWMLTKYMQGINLAGNAGGSILYSLGYGVQNTPSMGNRTATSSVQAYSLNSSQTI
ncbi:MAG: hypothetical protein EBU46_18365, partial [Nitrosomonadaceae bacterium]|nr:hypothetical protein [Nitrosomonadaceae bacterium]